MNRRYVIVGPHRVARRYAQQRQWTDDQYVIITRGHQLATLDPALIMQIITVKLHTLGARIAAEIKDEIDRLRALWPVPHFAAA